MQEGTKVSGEPPLRSLASNLWCIDRPLRVNGLSVGTRTTVVPLSDRDLFLHSPGPLDDKTIAALRSLGRVSHIVAPNLMHHLFIAPYRDAFPEARVWGAPGLARKTKAKIDETLGAVAPPEWAGAFDQLLVGGIGRLNEIVFFHRATRTLLVTDLSFNLLHSSSWLTRVGMRLNTIRGGGGYGRFGPTRLLRFIVDDPRALRRSVDAILQWDFDRVTVTHGDVLEGGGRMAFRNAFSWLPSA